MTPPKLCSRHRPGFNCVARAITGLLHQPPLPIWEAGTWQVSHTSKSSSLLQQPEVEGVTAQLLGSIPMRKAPEKMQFSISCPDHRNKAFPLLYTTLAFHSMRGGKRNLIWTEANANSRMLLFSKHPHNTPLLGRQRCFTNIQRSSSKHITSLKRNYSSRGKTSVKQAQVG